MDHGRPSARRCAGGAVFGGLLRAWRMAFLIKLALGPWGKALAILAVVGGIYYAGDRNGYQRALDQRAAAVQEAKERADEITGDVDNATDDDLIDGMFQPD